MIFSLVVASVSLISVSNLITSNPCACGDQDANSNVDLVDFFAFSKCFGLEWPDETCDVPAFNCADFGTDGSVNLRDFAHLANQFGGPPTCTPPAELEYGIKYEGQTPYAFIGIRGGREFAAVAFDPVTQIEDFSTQRLLGHTAAQLETLSPGTDAELIMSQLFSQAAILWQVGFSGFKETPQQEIILSKQSQLLAVLSSLFGINGIQGRPDEIPCDEQDWCTVVPDFDFGHCCVNHDICYKGCGPDAGSRLLCDVRLSECIRDSGSPGLANIFRTGVRVLGFLLCSSCDEPCWYCLCDYCDTCSGSEPLKTNCATYDCIDGVCEAKYHDNNRCCYPGQEDDTDDDCITGICGFPVGTCELGFEPDGSFCTNANWDCSDVGACVEGICRSTGDDNSRCPGAGDHSDSDCTDVVCRFGTCSNVCEPTGSPCFVGECRPDQCHDGHCHPGGYAWLCYQGVCGTGGNCGVCYRP